MSAKHHVLVKNVNYQGTVLLSLVETEEEYSTGDNVHYLSKQ